MCICELRYVMLSLYFKEKKSIEEQFGTIVHFTAVCLVTWPLSGSEAGDDLVLIKTLLLFTGKSCGSHAN